MQTDHCHLASSPSRVLIPRAPARHTLRKTRLAVAALILGLAACQAQLSVTDGLVLWLNATDGVAADVDGFVAGWTDQGPYLNDAAQPDPTMAPLLVPEAVNGHPALRFDGVDDYLEIANSWSLLPLSGDWTVLFVAKRLGGSAGDFPQVIGSRPWLRALDKGWAVSFDAAGLVCSHYADELTGHDVTDFKSRSPLSTNAFQLWQVEENLTEGTTSYFLNGDIDSRRATAMPRTPVDQADPIRIGREIGGSNDRRANMDLAEILVYNRALPREEREAVTTYLGTKYGFVFTTNIPPTASITSPTNQTTLAAPGTFAFTATAADIDGGIRQVEFLVDNQPVAVATQPPFSVPVKVFTPRTLSLTVVATDNRGERVVSAPVTVTVTGATSSTLTVTDGLQLLLDADVGVAAGLDGAVSDWADQSPNVNNAAQPETSAAPLLVAEGVNGHPVIRFDGVNSYMEIANSASLQPQSGDWTVFFVAMRNPGSQGDFPQVIGSRPWTTGVDKGWAVTFDTSGLVCSHYADGSAGHDAPELRSASAVAMDRFQIWQVEEDRAVGTTGFYSGGSLDRMAASLMPAAAIDQSDPVRIGREIGGSNNRRASMDLAEVLVYNRVLSGAERESVNTCLANKYDLPLLASQNVPPTVSITSPADGATFVVPTNLTLAATAADSDGSIVSVQFYRGATLLGTATSAPYSLNVTNTSAGTVVYRAVATDNLGATTRSAAVTITNLTLKPPVPAEIEIARGLISLVDYEDTFTVGTDVRADGLYGNNTTGGYNIEDPHGNPVATWTPFGNFSFNSGAGTTCCGYPGNTGNDGAATGLAQSGGGDFSIAYGLRQSYVVAVDAILPTDRLDVSSLPSAGAGLVSANSLTVFFRLDSAAGQPHAAFPDTGLPGIGLFNGSTETAVVKEDGSLVLTGINDLNWHNIAVHFDKPHNRLGIFVDRVLLTYVDLGAFANGAYREYSNAAVGLGGAGGVFWVDNFRVGAAGRIARSIDFGDTFKVGTAARADGLYNNNATGGYHLESDTSRIWTPFGNFSFNSGAGTTCCGYPGNTGNDGAASGLAQSGGGDFSFEFGVRSDYVVQVDAILPGDRFDISSMPSAGATIFAANSLTVFFRSDTVANLPGIGLFNGAQETDTGVRTGVADTAWHRFAVHFDQANKRLLVYVDGALKADLDLTTFAQGIYANYSNAAVGAGGAGGVFWADNFIAGPPEVTLASSAVQLVIERAGADVRISWPGPGVLESAEDLSGSWTPLPEARSPYPVTPTGAPKFYRVKQ